jgi:hypothetical protein
MATLEKTNEMVRQSSALHEAGAEPLPPAKEFVALS